jgi:drug/metabolite transporter (DMT)-like permease
MASLVEGGGGVSPTALAMTRMVGAAAFFQVLIHLRKERPRVGARDHLRLLGLSVFGVVLNQGLYLAGLHLTSAVSTSLLGATIPVFTAALAVLFREERASLRTAAGLALALTGVVALTGVSAPDRGAILVALNSLSYAFYVVLARKTLQRLGTITTVAWIFTWGSLLFAPLGAVRLALDAPAWTPRAVVLVTFIVLVSTILAYAANAWALARSTPTLVTVYIYLQPLVAAVLAYVQLGQSVRPRVFASAAFILVGVGIVAARRTRP